MWFRSTGNEPGRCGPFATMRRPHRAEMRFSSMRPVEYPSHGCLVVALVRLCPRGTLLLTFSAACGRVRYHWKPEY